jgi:hypothetical protein
MTEEQPLALVNDGTVPTLSQDALTIKREAVELAQSIVTVSNAQEQQDSIAAASLIKSVLKRIEAAYRAAGAWSELQIETRQGTAFFRGPTMWHSVLARK